MLNDCVTIRQEQDAAELPKTTTCTRRCTEGGAMSNLYDTDAVTWAKQQAALLRRLAAGERVNDQVDWENVVEEIEDVGGRERDKVTEALVQALRHKLCLIGWPHSTPVHHWEAEVRIHLATARRQFRNSMRQYMTPESWQGLSERTARDCQPHGG